MVLLLLSKTEIIDSSPRFSLTEVISWDVKHSNNKDKDKEVISWDVNRSNHTSPGLIARSLGRSALIVIGEIKDFVLISKTNTKTKKDR